MDTQFLTIGFTALLGLMGLASLLAGAIVYLKARALDRACTQAVEGHVVELADTAAGKWAKTTKKLGAEPNVVAANEAIAEKKRSYLAKRQEKAEAELRATAATWKAFVSYEVNGTPFKKQTVRATPRDHRKVGQATVVHYDPSRPDRAWLDLDGLPRTLGVTLMLCGAALIAMAGVFWVVFPAAAQLA